MKKSNLLSVCLIALFLVVGLLVAKAEDKVDMTGTWNLSVEHPVVGGNMIFKLIQNGNNLTGTFIGKYKEGTITGTVNGNDFEIKYAVLKGNAVYKGKVEGKKMSGEVEIGSVGEGTFIGEKETKS